MFQIKIKKTMTWVMNTGRQLFIYYHLTKTEIMYALNLQQMLIWLK